MPPDAAYIEVIRLLLPKMRDVYLSPNLEKIYGYINFGVSNEF